MDQRQESRRRYILFVDSTSSISRVCSDLLGQITIVSEETVGSDITSEKPSALFGANRGSVDGLAVFRANRGPRPSTDNSSHGIQLTLKIG